MQLIHAFTGDSGVPTIAEVGGKGLSLIKMARSGLPVPQGFVLTVDFFEPWRETLKASDEWRAFRNASPDELGARCDALKALCSGLEPTETQQQMLRAALDELGAVGDNGLFAVRSSSPEEDLEGASFAGGYETLLGVRIDGIVPALRETFASCLDKRIVLYKKEHGFDVSDPRIAVIVQEQIPSEVAGVGFSLNPLTNCYDEAVITANWGLGESVVSGTASPDQFVIDKIDRAVVHRTLGKKESSVWLTPDGGTEEQPDPRASEFTLSDEQLLELTDILVRVEVLYGKPMDIEWAYVGDTLTMLQARPITTHIPLPEALLTAPGEPRRLYLDVTLCIQGMREPLSAMGTSWLAEVVSGFFTEVLGRNLINDPGNGIAFVADGKAYADFSNILLLAKKESVASHLRNMDMLASEILQGLDESRYRATSIPRTLEGLKLHALWHVPDSIARVFEAAVLPDQLNRSYHRNIEKYMAQMRASAAAGVSLREFADETQRKTIHLIAHTILPTLIASLTAKSKIRKLFADDPPEVREKLEHLDRALPGNVTVEMGLSLYNLSQLLDPKDLESIDTLTQRLHDRSLPGGFLHAWDEFMDRYGFRGPCEIDVAAPRYCDNPAVLLQQMAAVAQIDDPDRNPQAIYDRCQLERHRAYEALSEVAHHKGWVKSREFQMLYRIIETFGGYRETHKYYMIMINHMLRRRVLQEADALVAAGRLDRREQVFDLTLDDLDRALREPVLDLRALGAENTRFISRIQHIRDFPHMIDSRGEIPRPPAREAREGEILGRPVSPGTATGPVKVLHAPDEKPLRPGDILVARATDPGWTPLFINAAAIVLEVGGMLQHGALVAREYGKPCIVGIENVTTLLTDGQIVEADGTTGVVRIVKHNGSTGPGAPPT